MKRIYIYVYISLKIFGKICIKVIESVNINLIVSIKFGGKFYFERRSLI